MIKLLPLPWEHVSKPTLVYAERASGSLPFTSPHNQTLPPTLDKCPKSSLHRQCQITHGFCGLTGTYILHICPTLDQGHKQALPGIWKRVVSYGWGCQHGQPLGLERPLRNVVRVGRKPTQIFFWNLSFGPSPKVIVTIFRLMGISHSSILCVSKNICMSLTMYYVHSVSRLNSRRNLEAHQHHCPQGHHSRHRHHPPPCQKASATWKRAKGSQQWPPFKNNTCSSAVPI